MNKRIITSILCIILLATAFLCGCGSSSAEIGLSGGESDFIIGDDGFDDSSSGSNSQDDSLQDESLQDDDLSDNITDEIEDVVKYTITFLVDGQIYDTLEYCEGDTSIVEPQIPSKYGYTHKWASYDLSICASFNVNAIYTLVDYTITFVAGDKTIEEITYNIENTNVVEPDVPSILGQDGVWSDYDLTILEDKTAYAVYQYINYSIDFMVDGMVYQTVYYTIDDSEIDVPDVPIVSAYELEWENFSLMYASDQQVNAIYYSSVKSFADLQIALIMDDEVTITSSFEIDSRYEIKEGKTVIIDENVSVYSHVSDSFIDKADETLCNGALINSGTIIVYGMVFGKIGGSGTIEIFENVNLNSVVDAVYGGMTVVLNSGIYNVYQNDYSFNGSTDVMSSCLVIDKSIILRSKYDYGATIVPVPSDDIFVSNTLTAQTILIIASDVVLDNVVIGSYSNEQTSLVKITSDVLIDGVSHSYTPDNTTIKSCNFVGDSDISLYISGLNVGQYTIYSNVILNGITINNSAGIANKASDSVIFDNIIYGILEIYGVRNNSFDMYSVEYLPDIYENYLFGGVQTINSVAYLMYLVTADINLSSLLSQSDLTAIVEDNYIILQDCYDDYITDLGYSLYILGSSSDAIDSQPYYAIYRCYRAKIEGYIS